VGLYNAFVDTERFFYSFCRATLCLFRRAVSVRLSVTFVYCIETSKHTPKRFHHPGSPTVLVRRYHDNLLLEASE